jgi:small conductance mechanosensitive channel
MNAQDILRWQEMALQYGSELGIKVLAAIAFWIIGRWLIGAGLAASCRARWSVRRSMRP